MRRLVVDASVAARFLLAEDLSERAGAVLDNFIRGEAALMAPQLIYYEVGNALWKAVSKGFIGEGEAGLRLGAFVEMGIGCLRLGTKEWQRALALSVEKGITFYDAAYVASAEWSGAQLLTADDKLFDAASSTVDAVHLREYG